MQRAFLSQQGWLLPIRECSLLPECNDLLPARLNLHRRSLAKHLRWRRKERGSRPPDLQARRTAAVLKDAAQCGQSATPPLVTRTQKNHTHPPTCASTHPPTHTPTRPNKRVHVFSLIHTTVVIGNSMRLLTMPLFILLLQIKRRISKGDYRRFRFHWLHAKRRCAHGLHCTGAALAVRHPRRWRRGDCVRRGMLGLHATVAIWRVARAGRDHV